MPMLVISDLHIADGIDSDEFKQGGQAQCLSSLLIQQPDHSVILLGDILDLLRAYLKDILAYWGPLIDLLFRKARVWIIGNHDAEALNFLESQYMGVRIREILILNDTIFMHGHQFDPQNIKSIGTMVTQMEDWVVENTGPVVGEWARELETLIKGGRDGEKAAYANRALDFIKNFWVGDTQIKKIYMGHTHQRHYFYRDGIEYFNTGCWIGGCSDYLEYKGG